ncbi:conserved hypothetical protein [Chlorobium limicola DSM 245]|uniref:SLBB domain-containing protein n=1 Tax=Chlorobium limicola (strain DSM 245 / NBRC 103803 / 6330) TaxID=290315 RepID=B3EF77_CHLL2|nr:hypothetical protein [Chlorobium limicola]ACD90939.1 conserved hypothetical protein [Chlorobium limicola DSM 245]
MKFCFRSFLSFLLVFQLLASPVAVSVAQADPFITTSSLPSLFSAPGVLNQGSSVQQPLPGYGVPQDSYFTDNLGNILMNVNVWGQVYKPGQVIVKENADLASVLSMVGGPQVKANLKKVRINRQQPDENGKTTYLVDLKAYYKDGDRSSFVDLKPNDTIIIPEDKGINTDLALRIAGLALSVVTIFAVYGD